MNKWVALGALALALMWGPFLYAELTSEPAEKRARDLPSEREHDDSQFVIADDEEEEEEETDEPEQAEPETVEVELEEPAEALTEAMAAAPMDPGVEENDEAEVEAEAETGEHEEGEAEGEGPPPTPPMVSGPTAVFKHAFDNEPRDALWAAATEQRIAALFAGEDLPEDLFHGAKCRKAVCQIDLRWSAEGAEAYTGLHKTISDQFGSQLGVEPRGQPEDGFQQIYVYVLRKGYNLNDLQQ